MAPLFVIEVKELVPFKMLATAVVVAYVELAVAVVKYELSEDVNA